MGVLALVNTLQDRATNAGIATAPILTAAAVFGADPPQGSLERFLAREIGRHLDGIPCLRVVVIGHSHGGATVTAVTAALDDAYSARVFGVLIDRTTSLYDRAGDRVSIEDEALERIPTQRRLARHPVEPAECV